VSGPPASLMIMMAGAIPPGNSTQLGVLVPNVTVGNLSLFRMLSEANRDCPEFGMVAGAVRPVGQISGWRSSHAVGFCG
jgi:hypothetical protein